MYLFNTKNNKMYERLEELRNKKNLAELEYLQEMKKIKYHIFVELTKDKVLDTSSEYYNMFFSNNTEDKSGDYISEYTSDQLKIIKKILFAIHPDKNIDNKENATLATQKFNKLIDNKINFDVISEIHKEIDNDIISFILSLNEKNDDIEKSLMEIKNSVWYNYFKMPIISKLYISSEDLQKKEKILSELENTKHEIEKKINMYDTEIKVLDREYASMSNDIISAVSKYGWLSQESELIRQKRDDIRTKISDLFDKKFLEQKNIISIEQKISERSFL